ncbi:MAG: leucyl aminopeptidase family protein [bacterium]
MARRLNRMLSGWLRSSKFKGNPNECTVFPTWASLPFPHIVVVGLGARQDFHVAVARHAIATAARRCSKMGFKKVIVCPDALSARKELPPAMLARVVASAIHRGLYDLPHVAKATEPGFICSTNVGGGVTGEFRRGLREGSMIGASLCHVRDLANMAGNEAPPVVIAGFARRLARRAKLRCVVWDRRKLAAERCRALLAVAQGSRQEPRMIFLFHKPAGARGKPIVLVGKTITFDTGGISIKPARSMEWMKYDKSGGMAVLAAMEMISRLRVPRPVIGILAAAENMPGGMATRPGDVVKARSGKTIEIINTDAEGRLVLADALSVAQDFKPAAILDMATLTGAAVTALGHVVSAVMGNSKLVSDVMAAGERTGDRVWPMPLYCEYRDMLKTPFADLKNTGDGTAGAIAGGTFLNQFVAPGTPWVHVDLTNAWDEREQSFSAPGANLFGAELAMEWVRQFGITWKDRRGKLPCPQCYA